AVQQTPRRSTRVRRTRDAPPSGSWNPRLLPPMTLRQTVVSRETRLHIDCPRSRKAIRAGGHVFHVKRGCPVSRETQSGPPDESDGPLPEDSNRSTTRASPRHAASVPPPDRKSTRLNSSHV